MSESHEDIADDGVRRKDVLHGKGKKDKKDKGYMIFEEEDSPEELFCEGSAKSQTKSKKPMPFKFSKKEKSEKKEKPEKEKEKKSRNERKKQEEKEKKAGKETKKDEKAKWKKKILLKSGEIAATEESDEQKVVFGVPLALAVERNPSHDGILLPAVVRECIDYISEYGLACEGIYRISGVKSKVTQLKELYNSGSTVYLVEHEPNIVASLLKLFLRELPDPLLTVKLMPKFEQASALKNIKQKVEQFHQLIQELPSVNKTLLSWVIVHMTHIIEKEKFNKMSLQNVSIVLSPTMKISHRVLNVLFTYSNIFFRDTIIKKYIPPLKPATSRWALELPECPSAIEEELKKQESLLNHMHEELMRVKDHRKEEELWEVQRIVTQLKRKLKHLHQMEQAPAKPSETSLDKKQSFSSQKSHLQLEHHDADFSSKLSEKLDRISLVNGEHCLSRNESGVRLRGRDHLKLSEKKHLTPELHSRRKVMHSDGFTKRHSSTLSDKHRNEGSFRTSLTKRTSDASVTDQIQEGEVSISRVSKVSKEENETSVVGKSVKVREVVETVFPANDQDGHQDEESGEVFDGKVAVSMVGVATSEVEVETATLKETVTLQEPATSKEIIGLSKVKVATSEDDVSTLKDKSVVAEEKLAQKCEKEFDVVAIDVVGLEADAKSAAVVGSKVEAEIVVNDGNVEDEELKIEESSAGTDVRSVVRSSIESDAMSESSRRDVLLYEEIGDNASDSSNPYTDVAEEDEDADSERRFSEKRVEEVEEAEAKNDYEVLRDETPSPWLSGRSTVGYDGSLHPPLTSYSDQGDSTFADSSTASSEGSEFGDHGEFEKLLDEYNYVMMEEEELLAIGDELRQKISTERNEIERLQQDISELQMMRHDDAFETSSSSSSSSSDSSMSFDDDLGAEEMKEVLDKLIQDNNKLETEKAELCEKIHQERMACLEVKVQNRMIQQRQLDANIIDLIDFE